jgi:hypothetical protein
VTRRLPLSLTVVAVAACCLAPSPAAAADLDRLDRFRELARTRLTAVDAATPEGAAAVYGEVYRLLDEEILESLTSGELFASQPVLQDRLDAFNEAWGATALRVLKLEQVLIGTFWLTDGAEGNSVRVYGRRHGEPGLLAAIHRPGRPSVSAMPSAGRGVAQFVVAWEVAPSGRGTTAVRMDLVRHEGDAIRTVWSTADVLGGEPWTRAYTIRPSAITVRYELHYPGWSPGCAGQTEQEDVFRYVPAQRTFVLAARRLHARWHRDLHAVVERLISAHRHGDARSLAEVVPDGRVRARLPAGLERESACDAADAAGSTVNVAFAAGPERRPWTLTFRRTNPTWRLIAVTPVLE